MSRKGLLYLFVVTMLVVASIPCQADHLNRMHRATGRAEDVLSGVRINSPMHGVINEDDVYIEPMVAVLKSLGTPTKIIAKNKCESNYIWNVGAVRIEVGSGCVFQKVAGKDVMRTHGAYAVEVWGTRALRGLVATGRGLALGDPWSKVQKLYGTRCNCGRYTSGTGSQNTHGLEYARYGRYQWKDGIEFDVDVDKNGRVVHMLLLGDIE